MLIILARLGRSESFWAVVKVRSPHTGPEVSYPRSSQYGGALAPSRHLARAYSFGPRGWPPRALQKLPRGPQHTPRGAQEATKKAHRRPKRAPIGPIEPQGPPKTAPQLLLLLLRPHPPAPRRNPTMASEATKP